MTSVVVYGTKFCPFCVAARRLLEAEGIDFKDILVDGDRAMRAQIAEKSGRSTVPQIWAEEQHIGGFTDLQRLVLSGNLDFLINSNEKQSNAL
jgi:glutaredoxin 3